MDRRIALGLLIALIAVHMALAATFAFETPYRIGGQLRGLGGPPSPVSDVGAPDERQHVNYVIHLADGQGFPVFQPTSKDLGETYQSHQPPAFYLLEAGWAKLTGAADLTSRASGLKLRFLNVIIGGFEIAGVFFLLLWGFGEEGIAAIGAAFAALLPMNAALSGAVSNDPLLFCLCTWALALLTRAVKEGWNWKLGIGIGVLTGLALLTKTTALALIPVILLALVLRSAKKPSPAILGASALIAIVIVAPWWVRNQQLYGDPLALQAFSKAFVGSAQKQTILQVIQMQDPSANPELSYWVNWVGWWTARSVFGVFGYMDIWLNEHGTMFTGPGAPNTLYRLLLAATFICAIGWIASLRGPKAEDRKLAHLLNGTFFVVVLLLFVRFNEQYFQAQARYLLPAIGPIAGAFAIGLNQLTRGRTYAAVALVVVVLGGVDAYALSRLPEEFDKRSNAMIPSSLLSQSLGSRSGPGLMRVTGDI